MINKIKEMVKKGYSIREMSKEMDMGYSTIKYHLDKNNIKTKHAKRKSILEKVSDVKFCKIVNESYCLTDVAIKVGYKSVNSEIMKKIKNRCEKLKVKIDYHIKNNKRKYNRKKAHISEILTKNSDYSRNYLKKRIIGEEILEYKCEICNLNNWLGKEISLHIDHINGINDDHRIENLRFLCPNCHSQTPTYSGKNSKKSKIENKSNQKNKKCTCGKLITNSAKRCIKCNSIEKRTTVRPPYEILVKYVTEFGYRKTGDKYGVSDNTIRKWVNFYEKNNNFLN